MYNLHKTFSVNCPYFILLFCVKVLTGQNRSDLPLCYDTVPLSLESEDLNKVLRLFLSESTFPSFVEAVEKELDSIAKEEEEWLTKFLDKGFIKVDDIKISHSNP